MTLSRLDRTEGQALVAGLTGGKTLPGDLLDQILARSDGVPLFIEELTKAVLESRVLREVDDGYQLIGPLPSLSIPLTLHASLLARLDRLASVKDVAQTGAALGREFTYGLLAAVLALPDKALQAAFSQLVDAELLFQRGAPPDAAYLFKHTLVQDAAYASLLRDNRQRLHRKIAHVLEERFPDIGVTDPVTLAHHYAAAGSFEAAASHRLAAARMAVRRYANREARAHLGICLDLLRTAPPGGSLETSAMKRDCLVLLGDLASLSGELESANEAYARALALTSDKKLDAFIRNKVHRASFATREGARICYYAHGTSGPTLVFVNPMIYGLHVFQPIVDRLCQNHRVITIDHRCNRTAATGDDPELF